MIYYTIIIPHKNTPDLLQFCLDSIPVRDDVQVIVVDDDSSTDIVDFDHFPNWKGTHYEFYRTKEGKGAGYERNVGLEHAEGKWITFVGADDFLLPGVGGIFDEEKETDVDLVFFRPKAVMLDDKVTESKRGDQYNRLIDRFMLSQDETEIRCRWLSDANKFYSLRMIRDNGIRFDEIRYSNDNVFSVTAGVCAEKVALSFLNKLFSADRKAFVLNFNRMRAMGYKKSWLLREVFKGNSGKSAFKRRVYAFFCTGL